MEVVALRHRRGVAQDRQANPAEIAAEAQSDLAPALAQGQKLPGAPQHVPGVRKRHLG